MTKTDGIPDLIDGLKYWENTPATLDGVLGGFGSGTLPRIDSLGSRQFLQYLLLYLCTVPSPLRPLDPRAFKDPSYRTRALDVGAGVGRVTSDVLLHMFDDVVILEPVEKFVNEAKRLCSEGKWKGIHPAGSKSVSTKSVTFLKGPLQDFDPAYPLDGQGADFGVERIGCSESMDEGYDVIWCQWTLGHLSDDDLVSFLKRARASLRGSPTGHFGDDGLIIVKENLCRDEAGNKPATEFDPDDSSVTRSNQKWLEIFKRAGLGLVRHNIQQGLPQGLLKVKMYALR